MVSFIFWAAVAFIVYHHVGYPAVVGFLLARRKTKVQAGPALISEFRPSVTVIVPAHNEAEVILAKIRNLVSMEYPADKLSIVLALDGCTDNTKLIAEDALRSQPAGRIILTEYQANVGKVAVLNDQVARAQSEIIALTDTSALVTANALINGVAAFADPTVGVVTGDYNVGGLDQRGEQTYWRYQADIRMGESVLAGPIGAHGAFYMFRRTAWTPLPSDTINDDFVLPMSIVLSGFKAVFEPSIVAIELERSKPRQEFRRRIRIGAGNLQQIVRLAKLCNPRQGWIAFTFISGKGLRGILPFLLATVICASCVLGAQGRPFFVVLSLAEGIGIALSLWGRAIPGLPQSRLFGTLLYLLEGYLALGIGAALVLLRRGGNVWSLSKTCDKNTPT